MRSNLETKVTITRVPVKGGELFRAEIGDDYTLYFRSHTEALDYAADCLNDDLSKYINQVPKVFAQAPKPVPLQILGTKKRYGFFGL